MLIFGVSEVRAAYSFISASRLFHPDASPLSHTVSLALLLGIPQAALVAAVVRVVAAAAAADAEEPEERAGTAEEDAEPSENEGAVAYFDGDVVGFQLVSEGVGQDSGRHWN